MPRGPRQRSQTGVYHVMVRGINKSELFFDKQDKRKYLEILLNIKQDDMFELYAYCLMPNHVHLLIKEKNDVLSNSMKRIGIRFVNFINWKYERVGHLFQDRFKSEEILTLEYLLACIRYIHDNAKKAGMVTHPIQYPWCSYSAYLQDSNAPGLLDKEFILGLFSEDKAIAKKEFIRFSSTGNEDIFLDIDGKDDKEERLVEAKTTISHVLTKYNVKPEMLKERGYAGIRTRVIREIRQSSQVTVQELSDLLGISKSMVYRS
ncbi:MAG: transposase [Clostridiales bacterium]|jgi:REP element-mobilizing transposase RayT|nr:transposase [Clostridiales bacterium]